LARLIAHPPARPGSPPMARRSPAQAAAGAAHGFKVAATCLPLCAMTAARTIAKMFMAVEVDHQSGSWLIDRMHAGSGAAAGLRVKPVPLTASKRTPAPDPARRRSLGGRA
jgi:hypothetical protein